MTDPDPGTDYAPDTAHRVAGLLGEFNRAGVLGVADVHTARAIGRIAHDDREQVQLAVALTVRALRAGSVCIDLHTVADAVFADTAADDADQQVDVSSLDWPEPRAWLDACSDSPMVAAAGEPDGKPLRLTDGLLYLERYWRQEETVRSQLQRRAAAVPPRVDTDRLRAGLARIFDSAGLAPGEPDLQRRAAAISVLRWVSVLAGGPGTGKTTTVAKLLALLQDQHDPGQGRPLRIALAAPTGKAAARLEEAVRAATAQLPAQDRQRIGDLTASTLHRLLGWVPQSRSRFVHHGRNHLPYDVVVVDEMSMVSLTLMARLTDALRPDARLVLVGDPDQLSSVEAGAVLADIAGAETAPDQELATALAEVLDEPPESGQPARPVVRLQHTWRFGGAIDQLARAIRASDPDRVMEILRSGDPALWFAEPIADPTVAGDAAIDATSLHQLRSEVVGSARQMRDSAEIGDVSGALAALDQHRLLCAHRRGPYGVSRWSREILRWLGDAIPGYATAGEWYPGRPLLITANDYELSLYNGDTGVVVQTPRGVRAAFARGGEPTMIAPVRLDAVQSVHAMTVHRAQGSQFRTVSFIVPPADSPLLTRELLYTAVTRATERVLVVGTEQAIRRATLRPANRASGLRTRL
ncbi:exodeoxyribonuclease V subunit alpha [Microlunatus soli]|nr:exodeoxyribonuclease V subunit alpha [Microlunatus soli]